MGDVELDEIREVIVGVHGVLGSITHFLSTFAEMVLKRSDEVNTISTA